MFPQRHIILHSEDEGPYLINPSGDTSGDTTGWTQTDGTFEQVNNPTPSGVLGAFWGGTSPFTSAYQRIDLSAFPRSISLAAIDAGTLNIQVEWWGGTWIQSPDDDPKLKVRFLNASEVEISTVDSGYKEPATVYFTNFMWDLYTDTYDIPAGTRYIDIVLDLLRNTGTNNDARVDAIDVSFFLD